MSEPTRGSIIGIVGGLMFCENMGDVHDEILLLCAAIGVDPPEGDFLDGWTDADVRRFCGGDQP
jgi:hypothetical protein